MLDDLAMEALNAMLMRTPMTVVHPAGWKRPRNWPLPQEATEPEPDGTLVRCYRPIAVLEYIDGALDE